MKSRIVLAASLLIASSGAALAGGPLQGSHFSVTFSSADQNLFGDPILLGSDVLRWLPPVDPVLNVPETTVDSYAGTLTTSALVTITADAGYRLSDLTYSAVGTFEQGVVDAGPSSFLVKANGSLTVTRLIPATGSLPIVGYTTGPITTQTFDYYGFPGFVNSPASWSAAASPISVGSGISKVTFLVQATLTASANSSAYSYITESTADLKITTVPVPEPETYALMLAGLGVIGFLAKRRRNI